MKSKKIVIFLIVVICGFKSIEAQVQGSQIKLAQNSDLILIGEVVSVEKPYVPFATNEPNIYQTIIFKEEKVLKGVFSDNFLRAMLTYDKEIKITQPDYSPVKVGLKYILLLKAKVSPDDCIQTNFEPVKNQVCYLLSSNALILALEDEVNSIKWLIDLEKLSNSTNKKKL